VADEQGAKMGSGKTRGGTAGRKKRIKRPVLREKKELLADSEVTPNREGTAVRRVAGGSGKQINSLCEKKMGLEEE